MTKAYSKKDAIDKLWRLGNLEWKLMGVQKEMRNAYYNSKGRKTTMLTSRRLGKTFVMMSIAVETCLRNPNQIVKVLFPKKKDAKDVSRFQMKTILDDCPKDLRPEWKEADKLYVFPNGSEIQMAGTDGGNAESVRGSACHLAIIDEAGFHDYNEFTYIIQSIIMPTLLTTKGKMILASTPSKEADHPFMLNYVFPSKKDGSLVEYTIHDNPLINEEIINEILSEYPGGWDDPDFRREYLNECDATLSDFIVPELTDEIKQDIIKNVKVKPEFYDYYTAGDPGGVDLTVLLFAYYDYLKGQLVVCDELVMGGNGYPFTTEDLADGVRRKEKLNFSSELTGEVREPNMRIMDNNNRILLNDLQIQHGLLFYPTQKDDKMAQVNKLRMMLKQGKIMIDSKCENLIHHLSVGRWDKNRKGFMRQKGDPGKKIRPHHCDAVDALLYMVRNIDYNKNPYPPSYFDLQGSNVFHSKHSQLNKHSDIEELMLKLINKKKN